MDPKKNITASIIVTVYNRDRFIGRCIESLLAQSLKSYEIILCNDGSTDGSRDIMAQYEKYSHVYIIDNDRRRGPSYSRNQGILKSKREFIAFTDSDCVADREWLEEIIRPFLRDPAIMITGGKVVDPKIENYWDFVNEGSNFIAKENAYVKRVIGCNMAFRRDFLEKHKFDEELKTVGGEELDLCIKCLKGGHNLYYIDSAKVVHYHRANLKENFKQHFAYGFSNTDVILKNHKNLIFIYHYWIFYILLCVLAIKYRNEFPLLVSAALILLIYFGTVLLTNIKLRNRTLWEGILASPGLCVISFAHSLGKIYYFMDSAIIRKIRSVAT